jgi:hypothetical protein
MRTSLKKILVICGAVISAPLVLVLSGILADEFYMRFMFRYDVSDFAPGDAFGEILLAILFAPLLFVMAGWGWTRLYQRISN